MMIEPMSDTRSNTTPTPIYRRIVQIEMVISGCAEWRNVKMAAVAHDGTLWLGNPSTTDPNWHQVPALPPIGGMP